MTQITYLKYHPADFDSLLKMSQKLWPDFNEKDLSGLLKKSAQSDKSYILIAKTQDGAVVGFAIFSIRTDYVEGAEKSPTGYLEGIFVESDFRKMGIAKEFVRRGEKWCRKKGCSQLGSDTWLNDHASRAFHKKIGFWEEEEVVHFLKNIE